MMKQSLADDLKQVIELATPALLALSETETVTPRVTGKWSPKEIIGHLIDSATNNHVRFVTAQLCDHLVFPGYEQEEWVRVQRYAEEPWKQLVELWRLQNLHLSRVIGAMNDETLRKPRIEHNLDQIGWQTVSKEKPVTLEYFVCDYVGHLKNHLRQILGEEFDSENP
jgi:hypothetical protein